jgi:hypothetical protein
MSIFSRLHALRWGCLLWMALGLSPLALALDKPQGKVLLTVTGRIAHANAGDKAVFDRKMLEALPQKTIVTQTPWYAKPVTFTGPLLRDVLAAAGGINAKVVEAQALDEYKVSIPAEDAATMDVVLAILLNGKPMSVREKGPLFVIYPFDSLPESKMEQYSQRSIWQLTSFKVH